MEPAPVGATRVLLVEDELGDALAVERSLRPRPPARERFAVQHAPTLAQGLQQLRRSAVDAVLLDLSLPDSQGDSTVARLRESDGGVPLVVFTGDDDPRLVARAFAAGADEYLVKGDVQAPVLRRAIQHAIERRRARRSPAPAPPAPAPRGERDGLLHGLKNLLTSILGNAQILQREVPREGDLAGRVEALLAAARTAAHMLCDGSDGEPAEEPTRLVDLAAFVADLEPLLRALPPQRVELRCRLAPGGPLVRVRPDALRRAVVELVANAVDSIGDADGCVEIRTGCGPPPEPRARGLLAVGRIPPGPQAWLEVRDDGRGFDGSRGPRLFEWGFSTKGPGRGRGLAEIQELVARHRGAVLARGRPGGGAWFRILLPASGGPAA